MHSPLLRVCIRSLKDPFCGYKLFEKGVKNGFERPNLYGTLVYTKGEYNFKTGTTSVSKSLQSQIVEALRLGERGKAFNLLSVLSSGNDLRSRDFFDILHYCATSPDPPFIMDTWRVMEEKEVVPCKKVYFLIIQALTKGGYLEEAFNWLSLLGKNPHTVPSLDTYNVFLNGCARVGNMDHANSCLDLMESQLVGKNQDTYAELLKLAVLQQNLSTVHEIWKQYIKYYSPTIIFLEKVIDSFSRLGDLVSAGNALQLAVGRIFGGKAFVRRSVELDIPIPSIFKDYSMSSTVGGLASAVEGDSMENHLDNFNVSKGSLYDLVDSPLVNRNSKMLNRDAEHIIALELLRQSFNSVIHACAKAKICKLGVAEHLYRQMLKLRLEPCSYTYEGLIKAVVRTRGVADGMKMLKVMERAHLKPSDATLGTLIIACSQKMKVDLAEALVDQIVETSWCSPFNALLVAYDKKDQPERAVRLLAKMKKLKLKLDIKTYEILFSLFGNVNAPYEKGNLLSQSEAAKRISLLEEDMAKNEVQHSPLSMLNLLRALGEEGMISDLIQYLRMAEDQIILTNLFEGTSIYNAVLNSLVEANETHMAVEIFKSMKLRALQFDVATYNIMIEGCSAGCFKSACAYVAMMLHDGFHPTTCTYTTLIKILLINNDFDEALYLLYQMGLEGILPDIVLFNTFLLGAYLKKRIDVIEFIVERMHQERIRPDPDTCSFVFRAYVDDGFLSTAMEALQVLSMRMISEEETVLEKKRKFFEENFIYAEDPEAELRIIKTFVHSEEYLDTALLNLRWCAVVGFPISWSPDQSEWAKQLSCWYSHNR